MICGIVLPRIYTPIHVEGETRPQHKIVVWCHGSQKIVFCDTAFWLNKLTTYEPPHMVIGHSQLPLKCRLSNRISFDLFYRCICKVETRACETLRSCAKRLGGLAVTISLGASRRFNPALLVINNLFYFSRTFWQLCAVLFVHLP